MSPQQLQTFLTNAASVDGFNLAQVGIGGFTGISQSLSYRYVAKEITPAANGNPSVNAHVYIAGTPDTTELDIASYVGSTSTMDVYVDVASVISSIIVGSGQSVSIGGASDALTLTITDALRTKLQALGLSLEVTVTGSFTPALAADGSLQFANGLFVQEAGSTPTTSG